MINWSLKSVKVSALKDYAKNPRSISKSQYEKLEELVTTFGLIDRPILNVDLTIIGGHQRVKILKKMKVKEVECWVPDREITPEEVDRLCIGLNLNQGSWDYDILANQFEMPDLVNYGFDEKQLLEMIKTDITSDDQEEDEQDLTPPIDPITKLGDLFELGPHRVICGDSTDPETVQRVLAGAEPILMVTDPPYGVQYDAKWRADRGGKISTKKVLNDDQCSWPVSYSLFPGSTSYIWCASLHIGQVIKDIQCCELEFKSLIIWNKNTMIIGRGDYHWKHEPCVYAVKKRCNHNWQRSRKESTVWDIQISAHNRSENNEKTEHSTQKPTECMARPIRNSSAVGEGVYDPFLGSGTTLIAAESLDRIFYGVELSPEFVDIIVKRWISYRKKHGKDPKVIRNGEECIAYV